MMMNALVALGRNFTPLQGCEQFVSGVVPVLDDVLSFLCTVSGGREAHLPYSARPTAPLAVGFCVCGVSSNRSETKHLEHTNQHVWHPLLVDFKVSN